MTSWVKPWRKVIERGPFVPGGRNGGAHLLKLECGHETVRKASAGFVKRVRCDFCPMEPERGSK